MHHVQAASGPIGYAAAFIAGVAGSVHCVAMCGGLAGALGMRARRAGISPAKSVAHQVVQQSGRITSYAVAGALCGGFSQALASFLDLSGLAVVARVLAGLCLIAISLRVLLGWQLFAPLERLGARAFAHLSPLVRGAAGTGLPGSFLLGALWGWLPCGLVYSMLAFAALSGGAAQGALILVLFGLGTWPAMLGGSLASAQLWRVSMAHGVHRLAGGALFVFGLLTLLAPLGHLHH
ncbi:MAG: sulfite exporter TauE/SafE family protein [Steroidobacteraceae bacterium]